MDIINVDLFWNSETSVLLVTSRLDICVKREIQYLYLNNKSIDTLNTVVHFYYGCHLRIVNLFRIGDLSLFVSRLQHRMRTFLLQVGRTLVSSVIIGMLLRENRFIGFNGLPDPVHNVL